MDAIPDNEVYAPALVVLPPITSYVVIAVCLVNETEEFEKFPDVTNDQYSVLLFEPNVPSVDPPEFESNASTWAVIVPEVVVGFSNENGR